MKDLSLSALSRGCGRFVSSNSKTGRHNGRLDVCFTPQDYYMWKSQGSLFQLSNKGRFLVEAESSLPKTYSTRRGPLLLYSQDLVTIETSYNSETKDKRKRVVRRYTQHVEQQLRNLKELTAAILGNSNNQLTSTRRCPPFFPSLGFPLAPDLHRPSPLLIHTTPEQLSPELPVQVNPQWLPAERDPERLENQPEDEGEELGNTRTVRLDLFLQIPCASRTPTPQREPQPWVHYVATSPEEAAQTYVDTSLQHTEINHHSTDGERRHPDMIGVSDATIDPGCSSHDGERTNDERLMMSTNRPERTGLLPPLTVRRSVGHEPCREKTDRPRREGPSRDEQHLPPIAESHTAVPVEAVQTQRDVQPKAERVGSQSQQHLCLPLLFPEKEERINEKQRRGGAKTERNYLKKETLGLKEGGEGGGGGGRGRLPFDKGSMILLEPGEEPCPPVGVLGCVAGRRGPGKQSSLAFLQNLQDPCVSSDANRGVVRGILPLELRDLQDNKPVGCLILGPDGEIIQISLYDNSQNPSQSYGDTQGQALQVLSAEGEKLPWVIVLQPEHTHSEGAVELNIDVPLGDILHHQSKHKILDLHTLTEMSSPSSHTDPVAVIKNNTKSAAAGEKTWKKPKRDAKNAGGMPPLREREGEETPRESNTEAEEEDEEEELGSTGQTGHLSGSHQPGEKLQFKGDSSCSEENINPHEATPEDTVDKKSQNTKRKDAEEASTSQGKRDMNTVTRAESDGEKMTRKVRRWQRQTSGSDGRPTRSQKQEERTNRKAADPQDTSALPSVKKKITDREGGRGEVKMNEERKEGGDVVRQEEESAGRRKRGRLKHKELDAGNHDTEEMETNQEMEADSHLRPSKRPSVTQRHEDADADNLSTNADKHSSIRSVSPIGSTAAAAASPINSRRLRRSTASSCEGAATASRMGLASSHGRLSSCSTVMITEEKLMLNPVKPESSRSRKSQEEAAALQLAKRAERRRQEVERKRKEQEEEERKQQEREQTEERMKGELEEERRNRAEEHRLKRMAKEEERRKRDEEEQEKARREQAQRERERRRQEERRRRMERLQRMREEEEQRRRAELERLRLEEERRQEEECKKLQEMDESERIEYLRRKEEEEEERRKKEEERRRIEEEAAEEAGLQAQLLARQMAVLQQQLAFKRGLLMEAGGLEKTQGISRPWIYSYFTLLQLLGLNPTKAETMTP